MPDRGLLNPFPECWYCGGPNDEEREDGRFYVHCRKCRALMSHESGVFIRHEPVPLPQHLESYLVDDMVRLISTEVREWPEVFYENPADFFDDNQVIDC